MTVNKQADQFPPNRIQEFAKLPIEKEVMELEYELEILSTRDVLTDYEKKLKDYLFKRCGKLWKKIHNSPHRVVRSNRK